MRSPFGLAVCCPVKRNMYATRKLKKYSMQLYQIWSDYLLWWCPGLYSFWRSKVQYVRYRLSFKIFPSIIMFNSNCRISNAVPLWPDFITVKNGQKLSHSWGISVSSQLGFQTHNATFKMTSISHVISMGPEYWLFLRFWTCFR